MEPDLRAVAEAFADTAERALAHFNAKNEGRLACHGMFHGDFANITPSVAQNLAWWAREFRRAIRSAKP